MSKLNEYLEVVQHGSKRTIVYDTKGYDPKMVEEIVSDVKNSLEDYESQGGRITKKVVRDSVMEMASNDATREDKKEAIERLIGMLTGN